MLKLAVEADVVPQNSLKHDSHYSHQSQDLLVIKIYQEIDKCNWVVGFLTRTSKILKSKQCTDLQNRSSWVKYFPHFTFPWRRHPCSMLSFNLKLEQLLSDMRKNFAVSAQQCRSLPSFIFLSFIQSNGRRLHYIKIVRAHWLAERCVCMRVCNHGCVT